MFIGSWTKINNQWLLDLLKAVHSRCNFLVLTHILMWNKSLVFIIENCQRTHKIINDRLTKNYWFYLHSIDCHFLLIYFSAHWIAFIGHFFTAIDRFSAKWMQNHKRERERKGKMFNKNHIQMEYIRVEN